VVILHLLQLLLLLLILLAAGLQMTQHLQRLDGWPVGQLDGWTIEQLGGWTGERLDGWPVGQLGGWTVGPFDCRSISVVVLYYCWCGCSIANGV
jgi:hypothetical protein